MLWVIELINFIGVAERRSIFCGPFSDFPHPPPPLLSAVYQGDGYLSSR